MLDIYWDCLIFTGTAALVAIAVKCSRPNMINLFSIDIYLIFTGTAALVAIAVKCSRPNMINLFSIKMLCIIMFISYVS